MQPRIAIIGKSQTLRSRAANYFEEKHHYEDWRLQDGITKIFRMLYPYEQYKHVPWEARLKIHDAFHKYDPDVWITFLKKRYSDPRFVDKKMVTCDARYLNEVKALKEMGYTILYIQSPVGVRALTHTPPGDLLLSDWYNQSFESYVGVDYTIYLERISKLEGCPPLDKIANNLTQT